MRSILVALLLFALSAAVQAAVEVHEQQLPNGMRVLVKQDQRAPIVVSQVWYRVGASYEPNGITGISHILEHMMFKGTKAHPAGEFSRIIAANGGEENAFTSRDYTVYHQTLAKERLEIALELEADRMRNLTLPADEFAKELEVVKEERRLRVDDRPTSLTYEQFNATAYQVLPYRNPVVGWMGDLEQMQVQDLREWYRLWYAPNNAILVVVGDVNPQEVFALAKKHFGPLQAVERPKVRSLQEPQQRGEVRSVVRAPARQPYLIMGYKTPVVATAKEQWEPYALEVLAAILDGGDSARFSRKLIRGQEVAVSAGAGYSAFSRLSGMLSMSGIPSQGHSVADLEQAFRAEIELLQRELVNQEELDRIRAQVVAGEVYELDSIYYQAMQIGTLETLGLGWQLLDQYADKINAVTAEQIREVARKYLQPDRLTVAQLEPLPLDQAQPKQAAAGGRHVD